MAYEKTTWKDHVVQHPKRFTATENDDGSWELEPDFGSVVQQGTAISAENLNHIEAGLSNLDTQISAAEINEAKMDQRIDALWKLNQGITWEFQEDDSEAFVKHVPVGAAMATVSSAAESVTRIDVVGKNLIRMEKGGLISTTGAKNDSSDAKKNLRSQLFEVDPGETYCAWVSHPCKIYVAFYTGADHATYIGRTGTNDATGESSVKFGAGTSRLIPDTAKYAVFTAYHSQDDHVWPALENGFKAQIEIGNRKTDYRPYIGTTIPASEMGEPFAVEYNGSITFRQENGAEENVASTVEYAVKISEVASVE